MNKRFMAVVLISGSCFCVAPVLADMGIPSPFPPPGSRSSPQGRDSGADFRRHPHHGFQRRVVPVPVYPYNYYQQTPPKKQIIIVVPPAQPAPQEKVEPEPPKEIKGKIIRPPGEDAAVPQEYKIEETPIP